MEALHEAHVKGITCRFTQEVREKYEKGQAEHGGNLWTKPGMMTNLRQEILDFVVYQDTLTEQLERVLGLLRNDEASGAQQLLDSILHGRTD